MASAAIRQHQRRSLKRSQAKPRGSMPVRDMQTAPDCVAQIDARWLLAAPPGPTIGSVRAPTQSGWRPSSASAFALERWPWLKTSRAQTGNASSSAGAAARGRCSSAISLAGCRRERTGEILSQREAAAARGRARRARGGGGGGGGRARGGGRYGKRTENANGGLP